MENKQENILVKSKFDSRACHKCAMAIYVVSFCFSFGMLGELYFENSALAFVINIFIAIFLGGIFHFVIYITAKNNEIVLTDYKVTGTYKRLLSLNIPIDSITSVSKGRLGALCVTCAGNKYNIMFVDNRDAFCLKLNELLNQRAHRAINGGVSVSTGGSQSKYDELAKLKQLLDNGIITQEEFDAQKKLLLGL